MAQLAATAGFPDKIGSAVWVDLKRGSSPDVGITVEILKHDKLSLDALVGHATFGAALGYDVARRGNLVVSVLAGIAHSWTEDMRRGWVPVAGLKVRL